MDKSTRPKIKTTPTNQPAEFFQNEVLRPILKQKHDLINTLFLHSLKKKGDGFSSRSHEEKESILSSFFKTNQKDVAILKGVVIGQFSLEEYNLYLTDEAAINKRILSLMKQRISSTF